MPSLPGRFSILLITFGVVGAGLPILNEVRGQDNQLLAEVAIFLPLIAGCYAAIERKLYFFALTALGVLTASAQVFTAQWGTGYLSAAAGVPLIVFFLAVGLSIFGFVLRAERVTTEILSAVLCVYLMIGMTWGLIFCVQHSLNPAAFRNQVMPVWQYMHYSFATLTTIGDEDVVAASRVARTLSIIETVMGQFYIAVVISQIVALRISHASDPQQDSSSKNSRKS